MCSIVRTLTWTPSLTGMVSGALTTDTCVTFTSASAMQFTERSKNSLLFSGLVSGAAGSWGSM